MKYEEIYDEAYFNGKKSVFYKFGYSKLSHFPNKLPAKVLKYISKGNVLDVGCAYGFTLKQFPNSFSLYGLDISKHAVSMARKNLPCANFIVHNAEEKFPYEKEFFDLVLMHDVIEHIERPTQVFKNVKQVLRNGGHLFVTTPNLNIIRAFFYRIFDRMEHHVSMFKHSELLVLLKENGFEVIEEWTFSTPFFPTIKITPLVGIQSAVICRKR